LLFKQDILAKFNIRSKQYINRYHMYHAMKARNQNSVVYFAITHIIRLYLTCFEPHHQG